MQKTHSHARWPPYGRPDTSLLLKVDHYLSRTGIMVRSSQYWHPLRTLIRGRGWSGVHGGGLLPEVRLS
jgi:hypothetical protein